MLDRRTQTVQKQIRDAGEDILIIQEEIGSLLRAPIASDDPGVVFRCRLILNKCRSLEQKLSELRAELPLERKTAISHSLVDQDLQILGMQKSTVSSLLSCIKQNNAILLEAKRATLTAEAFIIGERIKNNGKKHSS